MGFVFGSLSKIIYENSYSKPYSWLLDPIVVNCYGKEMPEDEVLIAIDYWRSNGESIGFYEHNPPKSVCSNESIMGFIILRKAGFNQFDSKTLASTRRYTSLTEIKSSVIWFSKGSYNLDLLIEHELGHALGYAHVEEEGNIMHPIYEFIGENF